MSRHRPHALARCLRALTLQDHPAFEVVLVADSQSLHVRPDLAVRRVAFDAPNISAARNAGIAAAAGDVVAFIDDDAVAEPTWLSRLVAPFADGRVLAVTGFTRGRDGLRWQCRAERIAKDGTAVPISVAGMTPVLLRPDATGSVSTLGTNCAFRRDALIEVNGFDPAFAYYLDESDLNRRMAMHFPDALTAIVPRAEVIHGWASDVRRHQGGVPRDLRVVGRSLALFCARYHGDPSAGLAAQRRRLLRLMVSGRLDPLRVRPLLGGLREGMMQATTPPDAAQLDQQSLTFTPLSGTGPRPAVVLVGWHWQAADLRARARAASDRGCIVTVILLSPTTLRHQVRFTSGGWWEQTGGMWGPSAPPARAVWRASPAARAASELGRLAAVRDPAAAGVAGHAAMQQRFTTSRRNA